ncbi:hypothetical protein QE152_g9199 [Popillia japonica]|uniref:Uncharacterized protein n=1 Tax=Popillia japonica TaxID=7064 RepID=A0AAW1LZE7_POPJA
MRTVPEEINQIDQKLIYQIHKLVKTAVTNTNPDYPTLFKTHPEKFTGKSDDDFNDKDSNVDFPNKVKMLGTVKDLFPETNEVWTYDNADTKTRQCPRWDETRESSHAKLGTPLNSQNIIEIMSTNEKKWNIAHSMIKTIMQGKEKEERERQADVDIRERPCQ